MQTRTITELNGFRAFAVLLVVFYHFNIYFDAIPGYNKVILKGGIIGVALFFILSGFLMTYPLLLRISENKSYISIKEFYKARLFRIIPLYLFVMIFFFYFRNHVHLNTLLPSTYNFSQFIESLIFLNDFLIPLNVVVWTLKIELTFYFMFPAIGYLIFILYKKNYISLLFTFLVLLFIIPFAVRYKAWAGFYSFYTNFDALIMGIIIAIVYSYKKLLPFKVSSLIWIFLIITGFILLAFSIHIEGPIQQTLIIISLGVIVIVSLYCNLPFYSKLLSSQVLGFIALISYSIYLWHFNVYYNIAKPLSHFIGFSNQKVDYLVTIGIAILVTFIVSIITYYTIEKPFLKLKNRI